MLSDLQSESIWVGIWNLTQRSIRLRHCGLSYAENPESEVKTPPREHPRSNPDEE